MPDPITLSALGAVALTEGIKFLYSQAGEVLKRWRERKEVATKNSASQLSQTEVVEIKVPPVFQGKLSAPQIHYDVVQQVEAQLRELRKDLSDYADGVETIDTTDEHLLQKINALRLLLEAIFQQRLTFRGEQRPASGPIVKGTIDVQEVVGYAAAVRARIITGGNVTAEAKANRVEGNLVGLESDIIGDGSFRGNPPHGG